MSEYDELLDEDSSGSEEEALEPLSPEEAVEKLPPLRGEPLDLPPGQPYTDDAPPIPVEEPDDETPPEEPPATREQRIRDQHGYGPSEKRTEAERAEVAERIKEKLGGKAAVDHALALPPVAALARYDETRDQRMAPIRKAFVEAQKKKEK